MTSSQLEKYIAILRIIAEKHGCILAADVHSPATLQDINAVKSYIGAPLPASLRAFFTIHDGLYLQFYEKASYAQYGELAIERCKLLIYGTKEIIKMTENFRPYIDANSTRAMQKAERCFEFANTRGSVLRIVFYVDAPRPNGEYAILNADLDCGHWYEDLDAGVVPSVAESFDDFLTRSLRFMVETERGFDFWKPNLVPMWPH